MLFCKVFRIVLESIEPTVYKNRFGAFLVLLVLLALLLLIHLLSTTHFKAVFIVLQFVGADSPTLNMIERTTQSGPFRFPSFGILPTYTLDELSQQTA